MRIAAIRREAGPMILALVFGLTAGLARGEEPADALLKLVPADAGATLVVEDLRGHARAILDSKLVADLVQLPAVRAWLDAEGRAQLAKAGRDIELAFKASFTRLRDDLLGDAVVLCLRLDPGAPAADVRGLLLLRARDRALLDATIAAINESEQKSGQLQGVDRRDAGGQPYWVRRSKQSDAYAILPGDIFAWSNSEAIIVGLLERRADAAGLAGDPRVDEIRRELPKHGLASLFVDPRFVERIADQAADAETQANDPGAQLVSRVLAAVRYAAATLEFDEGLKLHVRETLDAGKLDPWIKTWVAREGDVEALVKRVPAGALAMAAMHVDLASLLRGIAPFQPAEDVWMHRNFLVAARGLLLGRDPMGAVLPRLGPNVLAFLGAPGEGASARPPVVLTMSMDNRDGVGEAVDNALRTLLALVSLDKDRREARWTIEDRTIDGVKATSVAGSPGPFTYAVGEALIALGTSPDAVAAVISLGDRPGLTSRLAEIRAKYSPKSQTFACVDLEALVRLAGTQRAALLAMLSSGEGDASPADFDQLLAIANLFRCASLACEVDPEFRLASQAIALIGRSAP
ncbi:hypothetical protein EP7_005118 [Isosphaeraceae bacterium EP7]